MATEPKRIPRWLPWLALVLAVLAGSGFRAGALDALSSRELAYSSESVFRFRYAEMRMLGQELPSPDLAAQWPEGFARERELLELPDRVAASFHAGPGADTYLAARRAVGVFSGLGAAAFALLALAVLRRPWPAAAATSIYAGLFGAWSRSLDNYLREDFALPGLLLATAGVFQLLLGGGSRGLRGAAVAAAVGGALWAGSCWHMSQFYLALLGLLIVLTGLTGRTRQAALAGSALWIGLVLAALANEALRVKGALWSVGSALTVAPVVALASTRLVGRPALARPLLALVGGALGGAAALLGGSADYGHVRELVLAKLAHLGRYPGPAALAPDARLFWVGPYESPSALDVYLQYGLLAPLGLAALVLVVLAARRERSAALAFVALCVAGFGALYALMGRMTVFLAPWAAIVCVLALLRVPRRGLRVACGALLAGAIGLNAYGGLQHFDVGGRYHRAVESLFQPPTPPTWQYGSEQAQLLRWLSTAPPGALLSDFSMSALLLYATGRGIALHPMFEVAAIRPKVLEWADTMLADEQALLDLCQRWDIRYVIHYAPQVLGREAGSYWRLTGLEPAPGSVAHAMQFAPQSLTRFRLVLETYSTRVFEVGAPYDGYTVRRRHPLFDPEQLPVVPGPAELDALYGTIRVAQRYYVDGLRAQELGDLPRAAASYGNARHLHPDFEDADLRFGFCCLALGDFARAREALERAAALDPDDPRARELLGRIPADR